MLLSIAGGFADCIIVVRPLVIQHCHGIDRRIRKGNVVQLLIAVCRSVGRDCRLRGVLALSK